MTISQALKWAREELREVTPRPLLEAELLLAYLLKKDRIYLHLNSDQPISFDRFKTLVRRRKRYEPIEYILGKVSFFGEEFFIEKGVLIPRPETELLIQEVAKELKGDEKVAEIGVGSGVISTMLKKLFPNLYIVATDINPKALLLAKRNFKKFGVEVELVESDLLKEVKGEFDLIISNPPYISKDYPLPKELEYEPKEALIGGEQGDEVLKEIIELFLSSDTKMLACEIGYNQKESLLPLLKDLKVRFYKDFSGWDRGFIAKKEKF